MDNEARPPKSVKNIAGFATALVLLSIYVLSPPIFAIFLIKGGGVNWPFVAVFAPWIIGILLFLLYRLLSELRLSSTSHVTDRLDDFFYENRWGSLLLLVLCVPWFILGCYGGFFATMMAGSVLQHWDEPKNPETSPWGDHGIVFDRFMDIITLTSPITMTAGMFWLCRTALRAFYRVLATGVRRRRYASVPLGLDDQQQDELVFRRNVLGGGPRRVGQFISLASLLPR